MQSKYKPNVIWN